MKRKFSLIIIFVLIFTVTANAQIKVFLNNNQLEFDQQPVVINGRTFVPMRKIFNELGANIEWDKDTNTATAYKDGNTVKVTIGQKTAFLNNKEIILNEAPVIIGDRTMVPLRFIAESLNCRTDWQEKTENIYITDENNKFVCDLKVVFFDVGQGDCIFIILPDGRNMIIDGASSGNSKTVINKLNNLGITDIDYVVGTHPHNDHIGGLDNIINEFNINYIYMPKKQNNTETFLSVLEAVKNKGLTVTPAKAGLVIFDYNGLKGEFIAPVGEKYSELNNWSAVFRLTYLNKTFLFTGDAEFESEFEQKGDISADVLKIAHHGSESSTSDEYIKRVKPRYGIISVGINNSYGHPSNILLSRLAENNVTVFRTDEQGDIVAITDGYNLDFKTGLETNDELYPQTVYVTAKGKKFHKKDCQYLTDSKRPISYTDAIKSYEPCSACFK